MINPSLDELLNYVDSKYTLVIAVAKRARQLALNPKPLIHMDTDKPVLMAIYEIKAGKIKYKRTKEGIK